MRLSRRKAYRKAALGLLFFGLPLLLLGAAWGARHTGLLTPGTLLQALVEQLPPGLQWGKWEQEEPAGKKEGGAATAPGKDGGAGGKTNGATPGAAPARGVPAPTSPGTPGAAAKPDRGGTASSPAGAARAPEKAPFPSQEEIEAYYLARLEAICRHYEGKLNSLAGSAYKEYTAAREQGKEISIVFLAKKYIAAGSALEKECDVKFYAVLADFKNALRKNSFPLDKPREAEKEYERAKAARKKQLLSAAAKLF